MIGTILLDKYEIIKEIGRGGMAIVYLAIDKQLKREVAVKMLHPHMKQSEHIVRFEREAVVLATLSHQNIVNIYEFFEFENNYFIIYEYINGETLGSFIEKYSIKYPVISLMIIYQIIEAIQYIHDNGIIHRDIKPDNIMISKRGHVKVMDFGIAKVLNNTTVTDAGVLLGSPAYMSPEQVVGGEITYKSDIFAIGILTYRLLSNKSPFISSSTASTLKNILNVSYSNIIHPLVDKGMMRIIDVTLQKDPKKRIDSLELLKRMINSKIEDEGKSLPYNNELSNFFTSPEKYQKELKNTLLNHYKNYSYQLYKNKNILKSLNYCSKALELSPKDPQLRVLSNKLKIFNNGKRLRIIISFFLVLALILFLFINIIFLKQNKVNYNYKLSLSELLYLDFLNANKKINSFLAIDDDYVNQILGSKENEAHIFFKKKDKKKVNKMKRKYIYETKKEYKLRNKKVVLVDSGDSTKKVNDLKVINKDEELIVKKKKIIHIKFGLFLYCFRPYARVYIDDKLYPDSCITKKLKLAYGKHEIIAKYPYSSDFKRNININKNNKHMSIRYSFNNFSKVYLNLKSIAPITISLKNEYGEYVKVETNNNKNLLFKNINSKEVKVFFVKPGKYYMDITNNDIYYNNLLLNVIQKRNYNVKMDLENDKNIKIQ